MEVVYKNLELLLVAESENCSVIVNGPFIVDYTAQLLIKVFP